MGGRTGPVGGLTGVPPMGGGAGEEGGLTGVPPMGGGAGEVGGLTGNPLIGGRVGPGDAKPEPPKPTNGFGSDPPFDVEPADCIAPIALWNPVDDG
jgi:hypothetical protein